MRRQNRAEPSAPPIHMMPSSQPDAETSRERSPPPRYEEAIADIAPFSSSNLISPIAATTTTTRNDHQQGETGQQHLCSSSGGNNLRRRSPNVASSPPSPSSNSRNGERGSRCRGRAALPIPSPDSRRCRTARNNRFGSASPGELSDSKSDDDDDEDQENYARSNAAAAGGHRRATSAQRNKKRSSGSKIKRGLENIAFFIIQILD